MRWRRCELALLLGATALAGCNDTSGDPAASPAGGDRECTEDYDEFVPGVSTQARPGNLTISLSSAEPSPPAVRSDNVWQLGLSDADGAPILEAELLVSPYMPKHQHGSAEVVVKELGEGEYRLSAIQLIMPGVWEVPISVMLAGGETSKAEFRLCIAEQ